MVEILGELTNFIINLVSSAGYPGIVFAMAAENLFPPIPSEAVMPLAGYLTTTGRFNLFLTIGFGTLGSLVGAVVLYYVGVWVGEHRLREFLNRYGRFFMTTSKELDAAESWFEKHGEKSVLLCRMVPIVRSIISIPAGLVRMPLKRFMIFTTIGTTTWTAFLTIVGVVLGENWEKVGPLMSRFDFVVIGGLGVLVLYYVFRKMSKRKTQNSKPHLKSQNS
jgi:membrane protein DedA with SNARE-associated domain